MDHGGTDIGVQPYWLLLYADHRLFVRHLFLVIGSSLNRLLFILSSRSDYERTPYCLAELSRASHDDFKVNDRLSRSVSAHRAGVNCFDSE